MCSYSTVWLVGCAFLLERPPARKFLPTWSLPCVLEALAKAPFEPLAEASLRDVTIKTFFLMAIASGIAVAHSGRYPRPPATFVEMGCAWYRTPHMWLRIGRLLLSLSRFSYPASLGTLIGVRRQGLVSWSTFRVLRTGGRGDQFFICTREPFSPRFEICHFEVDCGCYPRSWPLGAVARGYASCTRHQEHQTRPGRCLRGFFPLRRSGSLLAVA